ALPFRIDFLGLLHLVQQAFELGDALEATVHGNEAHVGDLVDLVEVMHDPLADLRGEDFAVAAGRGPLLDRLHDLLEAVALDRALAARGFEAPHHLLAIERVFARVALDHERELFVDPLARREPVTATIARPAAADRQAVAPLA